MTRWRVPYHRSKRGIALMLTLVVTFFLMILLGAFVIVHRGNSSLTVSGQKRQRAYNVCTSGLHFLWGELEENPMFGAAGLTNGPAQQYPAGEPLVQIRYFGEPPEEPGDFPDIESNYIEGEILETSDTFVVRFINNLENRSAAEATQMGTVPARCAKVEITGTSGGVTLKLESILRKKPFVDYSMLSNDQLKLALDPNTDEDKWFIGSEDPYINQIRSNLEIVGPSALEKEILFQGPPRGGVAKAKEDIVLDNVSVLSDPDFMTQSQKNAKGTFQVGTSKIDVPGLKREDLRLPNNTVNLQGGELTIRKVEKHDWESQVFPVDTDGDGTFDSNETRHRLRKVKLNAIQYGGNLWIGNTGQPDGEAQPWLPSQGSSGYFPVAGGDNLPSNIHTDDGDYPVLYSSTDARVQADLTTGDIAFSPGSKFEFNGGFSVGREKDVGALEPNVLMGYELQPGSDPYFSAGDIPHETAAENPEQYSTALITNGSLELEGPVSGYGTLFADERVSLEAQPTLSADPVLAVALHGRSVDFVVQEPQSGDKKGRVFLETDWEVFQKGIDTAPGDESNGYEVYKNWHENTSQDDTAYKNRTIGDDPDPASTVGLRHRKVGMTGQEAAQALGNEFGLTSNQMPNFNLGIFAGWNGGNSELTLEQYVGLREYLRKPDISGREQWITQEGTGFQSTTSQIRRQIEFYSKWAVHMNKKMDEFMTQTELKIADVFFVGLVHAGEGGFKAEAGDFSLYFEGALVSQGNIDIKDTPWAKFVYNRDYLDDVVKHNFSDPIQLDQVYFKLN
jgi:hypothetical protein